MKLLVFTYAPAGLGHLRVTGALVHSRPKNTPYVLMGSNDPFISRIHRFTSNNYLAKKIFEASQYGFFEDIFTSLLVWLYKLTAKPIYYKMVEIIDEHPGIEEITVVATHFGLAHQIGAVKEDIYKTTKVKINLIVQVTDDTSQHIWCVEGADLTMVPSEITKKELSIYARQKGVGFKCEVSPYPISPLLTVDIPVREGKRELAFVKGDKDPINVIVPISGAAVGLNYFSSYLTEVDKLSSRFHFLIVAKRSSSTNTFLRNIGKLKWVQLITGRNDNEVVRLYEKTYQENLIHIELTKPSEQAFKALIPPTMIGGSVLLFTSPVGRQEVDNINFLKRHHLLPGNDKDIEFVNVERKKYIPRGLSLPNDPEIAARFTIWCLESGLFEKMASDKFQYAPESYMTSELGHSGAWIFWEELRLAKLI